jgi:hypothetical protein
MTRHTYDIAIGISLVAGFAITIGVAACTPAAQQATTTLLQAAAASNTTVASAIAKGALFCNSPKFGTVVALASTAGGIVSVVNATIGQDVQTAASTVLSLCQSVDAAATPVPPPTTVATASVPVVTTAAAPAAATLPKS